MVQFFLPCTRLEFDAALFGGQSSSSCRVEGSALSVTRAALAATITRMNCHAERVSTDLPVHWYVDSIELNHLAR